jgi:hypothetical protein
MSSDYKPRLTIELRQDQLDELRTLIDWGVRSRVFEPIIDDLILLLRKDRAAVTALLISREIHLNDFLQKGFTNGND